MEDFFVALISGLVELFCEILSGMGNNLWCWGDISDFSVNLDVVLTIACIVIGAGAGTFSATIVHHALLPKASLRIAALLLSPPTAGLGMSHFCSPLPNIESRLFSRTFWLPFWLVLAFLAMRLIHVIK